MLAEEAEKRYGPMLARPVSESPDAVLTELRESARRRASDAMASILLRADALALAELLAGRPLADAEEAHAPFGQTVRSAERALAEARDAWKAEMMESMRNLRPEAGVSVPTADSAPVDQAWQTLREAQSAAEDTGRHLQSLREKIERLRGIPGPNPADVAILARALMDSQTCEWRSQ